MLAGGIAVSTVCYAVLEGAVLNAIPYESPRRLVHVMKSPRAAAGTHWRLTRVEFETLRSRARCFESLGYAVDSQESIAGLPAGTAGAAVTRVSRGLLDALKVRPLLGRPFGPEDFHAGSRRVALLSFGFWSAAFSADVDAVGKHVTIGGDDYIVLGVMPKALRRPVNVADVWVPDTTSEAAPEAATVGDKLVIARLREGVSIADAQREVEGLVPASIPGMPGTGAGAQHFVLLSLVDQVVGPAGRILNLLLAACLCIQLLACLNVGHLLLARRVKNGRDLGIQLALGCGKGRLCLNVLAEASGVALAAVIASIPLVMLMLPAAVAAISAANRSPAQAHLSPSVFAFSIGLGILSSLISAVIPALLLLRLEAASLIQERWRMSDLSFSASRVQDALIVPQVAAAVIVLAGFGLLGKSVYLLSNVSLGFDPERLSYSMFSAGSLPFPQSAHRMEEAMARLARLPSVAAVAAGSTPPLTGAAMRLGLAIMSDEGEWMAIPPVVMQSVSSSYFATMGIPLLKGRAFDGRDTRGAPCVAIVNRSFARLVWSSQDAAGKRIDIGGGGRTRFPCEIVGVVGDAREITISAPPEAAVYFPHLQRAASSHTTIVIRSAGGGGVPVRTLRQVVADADPTRQWNFSTDIDALVATAIKPSATRAKLIGALAALALLLAAGGMYAATRFSLSRRSREFGVRMALGAGGKHLVALVYGHYARLASAGALAGALAGAPVGHYFGAGLSLFEIKGTDITVFAAVPVISILIVLAAIATPTVRAASGNPAALLRTD
jgi:putative ABC transport system permease protein